MQDDNADNIYTSAILSGRICAMLGLDWQDVLDEAGLRVNGTRQDGMFLRGNDYILIWDTIVSLSGAPDIAEYLGTRMAQGPAGDFDETCREGSDSEMQMTASSPGRAV